MSIASKQFGMAILRGLMAIFLLEIVASFIFSSILAFTSAQESDLKVVITAASFVSMFAGGFIAGGKGKEKGWMLGGATGLLYSLIIFLFQYLGYDQLFTGEQIIYHTCFVLIAMMGGILGVNLSSKSRTAA
jgi:putative membrane protein (TIGR04086 family)